MLPSDQTALRVDLMRQNTGLTTATKTLTEHVEGLTAELHARLVEGTDPAAPGSGPGA